MYPPTPPTGHPVAAHTTRPATARSAHDTPSLLTIVRPPAPEALRSGSQQTESRTAAPAGAHRAARPRFGDRLGLRSLAHRAVRAAGRVREEAQQRRAIAACSTPSERRDLLAVMSRHTAEDAMSRHEERVRLLLIGKAS